MTRSIRIPTAETPGASGERHGRFPWTIGVIAVLVVAFAFRLYGLHWDGGYLLHPDERFQLMVAVDRIRAPQSLAEIFAVSTSPWNPRRIGPDGQAQAFAYGALPLYVLETTSWLLDRAGAALGSRGPTPPDPYQVLAFRGRVLTAVVDVIGIVLALAFAKRAFGPGAALLTGMVLGTSVLAIQQAHFFVVDPWAATFGVATLWCAYHLASDGTRRWAVGTGIVYAGALACKASMWPLAIPIGLALGWRAWFACPARPSRSFFRAIFRYSLWLLTATSALAAYAAFEPYSVLDPVSTLRDIVREWQIARGELDVPYTRQYVDTVPIVYQVVQLARWGIGPVFAALAVVSAASALTGLARAFRACRTDYGLLQVTSEADRLLAYLLLLAWIAVYILTAWTSETKYLRYSLPLLAPFAILSSGWLVTRARSAQRRAGRALILLLTALLLVQTATWALAFSTVYSRPHTRISASEWIAANIPPGATLGVEHWDDRLPLPLPGMVPDQRYRFVSLAWYDDRTPEEALAYLAQTLSGIDYIVLASDRLAGSIPRLPWRYPVTSEYYRLLDTGALGFQLVYEGKVESQLGFLRLDDYAADESFTVYDHPPVRIYRKVRSLSDDELRTLFAWALDRPYAAQRERPEAYKQLLGIPVEALTPARDIGWSDRWLTSDIAAIAWWGVLLVVLALVGLPLVLRVAAVFPDGGIGLARALALLLVAYPVWLLASWHLFPFELPTIVAAIALVALVSWRLGWQALRSFPWRARVRAVAMSEAAFWLCFGFFLFLRWRLPDLWHPYFGGEKPMELAYTNAVARSRWMPPYDPWFADGVQNYYYYGFFLTALLWKLSGILPERAFQLTVATFAGLVGSTVASLGMELARRVVRSRAEFSSQRVQRWILLGGVGAVWWVLFAGNLDPLLQVVAKQSLHIDFWQSSRVVSNAITEFPYFSFLFTDLHPHVLALPVWLTAVALAVALHGAESSPASAKASIWLLLVFCAGSAAVVNSWDLPLAAALTFLGSLALVAPRSPRRLLAVVLLGALGVAAMRLWFLPFYERFVSPVTAVRLTEFGSAMSEILVHFGLLFALPALALAVVGLEGVRPYRRLGLVAAAATVAGYGFGMATLALFLRAGVLDLRHLWSLVLPLEAFLVLTIGLSLLRFYPHLPETRAYVVLVGVAGGALAAWRPVAGSLLIVALVAGTWLLANWRRAAAPVVALAVLGVGIIAASDLFVVVDDLYGSPWERMNTVFKLFNEAWPLLAISGWIAVLWGWSRRPPIASARAVATPLLVFTALAASLYLLLGTPQRLALRWPSTPSPGSLDGYAWMNGGRYLNSAGENIETTDDYRVIQWLRTHVTGNPVVLEASIGPYRGNGSRISSATGLPTVLGWDRHERQQRTVVIPIDSSVRLVSPLGDAVDQRLLDVRQLYDTTDVATKRELLARYRVRYVVVGQVERSWLLPAGFAAATRTNEPYASPEGLAAFTALEGSTLHRVATFGSTVIYEVRLTDVEQRG